MVAKTAQYSIVGRDTRQPSPVTAAHCNDNHDNHVARGLPVNSRRMRRPVLVCGWRKVPATGALECFWHIESDGASAAEEPSISCSFGRRRRLHGVHVAVKEARSAVA
jgi:hypothetical protein